MTRHERKIVDDEGLLMDEIRRRNAALMKAMRWNDRQRRRALLESLDTLVGGPHDAL